MIKAILFDAFGVLIGSSFWDVYEIAGGDSRMDEDFIDQSLQAVNSGEIIPAEFNNMIAARIGIDVDKWLEIINGLETPNLELIDYIRKDLKQKFKLAIISNAGAGTIAQKLDKNQIELFDQIIESGHIGLMKPDIKIFSYTCQKLGVGLDEVLFIDDLERYVLPARQYGIRAHQYKSLRLLKDFIELNTED